MLENVLRPRHVNLSIQSSLRFSKLRPIRMNLFEHRSHLFHSTPNRPDSSTSESLKHVQSAFGAISRLPYCSGTVRLDPSVATLFYTKNGRAESINFTRATDEQLAELADACQQATFGLNDKDILDQTYRKAGKLDTADFATQFSPITAGIVDIVKEHLFLSKKGSEEGIQAELYKLNVYGPGSFFKPHVDTPRSEKMFGSLVVVLPTVHEGGSLLIRHEGRERAFNTAHAVNSHETPHAAFVAFYSDVEHEVSLVTSGYRVTLTYNLYISKPSETIDDPITLNVDVYPIDHTKDSLANLLAEPAFLPDGGYLGFGLSHRYPFNPASGDDQVSQITNRLKGTDADLKRLCETLSLKVVPKAIYTVNRPGDSNACIIVDKFITLPDIDIREEILGFITREHDGATLVYPDDKREEVAAELYDFEGIPRDPRPIVWIKPFAPTRNEFETPYIAYGNEACMACIYGDVCLVVEVGRASERSTSRQ